jgi:hypothetical protein
MSELNVTSPNARSHSRPDKEQQHGFLEQPDS